MRQHRDTSVKSRTWAAGVWKQRCRRCRASLSAVSRGKEQHVSYDRILPCSPNCSCQSIQAALCCSSDRRRCSVLRRQQLRLCRAESGELTSAENRLSSPRITVTVWPQTSLPGAALYCPPGDTPTDSKQPIRIKSDGALTPFNDRFDDGGNLYFYDKTRTRSALWSLLVRNNQYKRHIYSKHGYEVLCFWLFAILFYIQVSFSSNFSCKHK